MTGRAGAVKKDTMRGVASAVFYLALFLLFALIHLLLSAYADDDAYIHFRIAEDLLDYGVPYFNPDEAVMASSSSGWTLTLALVFGLFGRGVKLVAVLNAAVVTGLVYVSDRILRGLTGRDGLIQAATVAVVVVSTVVLSSTSLMETPAALLIVALGVLMYMRGDARAFALLGAAVFFRPEAVVFLVVFALHALYRKAVPGWKAAVYAALGAAPFVAYNYYFFGTNVPHTVRAKSAVYTLTGLQTFADALPGLLLPGAAGRLVMLLLIAAATVILLRKGKDGDGRDECVMLMLISGLAVLAAYIAKGVYVLHWYMPLYALPIFGALAALALKRRSLIAGALVALALLPYVRELGMTAYASVADKSAYPLFESGARVRKYLDVGARLYKKYPDSALLSSEIGGLGYSFRGRIHDAAGLVSEAAVKHHPMRVPQERPSGKVGAIPPGYVAEVRPEIIVSYDNFAQALKRSDVIGEYNAAVEDAFLPDDMRAAPSGGLWGGGRLNVYIRKDAIR